jgi:hypothetical protein
MKNMLDVGRNANSEAEKINRVKSIVVVQASEQGYQSGPSLPACIVWIHKLFCRGTVAHRSPA